MLAAFVRPFTNIFNRTKRSRSADLSEETEERDQFERPNRSQSGGRRIEPLDNSAKKSTKPSSNLRRTPSNTASYSVERADGSPITRKQAIEATKQSDVCHSVKRFESASHTRLSQVDVTPGEPSALVATIIAEANSPNKSRRRQGRSQDETTAEILESLASPKERSSKFSFERPRLLTSSGASNATLASGSSVDTLVNDLQQKRRTPSTHFLPRGLTFQSSSSASTLQAESVTALNERQVLLSAASKRKSHIKDTKEVGRLRPSHSTKKAIAVRPIVPPPSPSLLFDPAAQYFLAFSGMASPTHKESKDMSDMLGAKATMPQAQRQHQRTQQRHHPEAATKRPVVVVSSSDSDEEEARTLDVGSTLAVANASRLLLNLAEQLERDESAFGREGPVTPRGQLQTISKRSSASAPGSSNTLGKKDFPRVKSSHIVDEVLNDGVTVAGTPRGHVLSTSAGSSYPRELSARPTAAVMAKVMSVGAHHQLRKLTNEEIGGTWGALRRLVRKMVADIAVPLCPKPSGVLKRIRAGTPAAVPVAFDTADEALLASLSTKQPSDYVIDDPSSGYQIRRHQLETCIGREWLSDQVINFYCQLVNTQISGVCTLGTFFFTKLDSSDSEGAHRWLKKQPVFSSRIVLVVINRSKHWTLCAVDNTRGTITYYDSLGGAGEDVMERTLAMFDEAFERKFGMTADKRVVSDEAGTDSHVHMKYVDFKRISPRKTVPQQNNVVDCGVFTTQFCLYAALGLKMNFVQQDIPYLRRLIMVELLAKKMMLRL